MQPKHTRLLTYHEVAQRLGMDYITVWRLVKSGNGPRPINLPGAGKKKVIRFDAEELEAWIEKHK